VRDRPALTFQLIRPSRLVSASVLAMTFPTSFAAAVSRQNDFCFGAFAIIAGEHKILPAWFDAQFVKFGHQPALGHLGRIINP
jgi:hypothetical protein